MSQLHDTEVQKHGIMRATANLCCSCLATAAVAAAYPPLPLEPSRKTSHHPGILQWRFCQAV